MSPTNCSFYLVKLGKQCAIRINPPTVYFKPDCSSFPTQSVKSFNNVILFEIMDLKAVHCDWTIRAL